MKNIKELNILETQIAISKIKKFFIERLSKKLNLIEVVSPLFLEKKGRLNDYLNDFKQSVKFDMDNKEFEIIQSLAKWKRMIVKKYDLKNGEGILADMVAIRKDEILDSTHSHLVDQWDWEQVISEKDLNIKTLKKIVRKIYFVFKKTLFFIEKEIGKTNIYLPKNIKFITSEELLKKYPNKSSKIREKLIVKEFKAVFLISIGEELSNGKSHDERASDCDNWELNGDLLFYNKVLDDVLEISSMGIRVCSEKLIDQLKKSNNEHRKEYKYHKKVIKNELPYTIGGGIGKSRVCMFFLEKKDIEEVHGFDAE